MVGMIPDINPICVENDRESHDIFAYQLASIDLDCLEALLLKSIGLFFY